MRWDRSNLPWLQGGICWDRLDRTARVSATSIPSAARPPPTAKPPLKPPGRCCRYRVQGTRPLAPPSPPPPARGPPLSVLHLISHLFAEKAPQHRAPQRERAPPAHAHAHTHTPPRPHPHLAAVSPPHTLPAGRPGIARGPPLRSSCVSQSLRRPTLPLLSLPVLSPLSSSPPSSSSTAPTNPPHHTYSISAAAAQSVCGCLFSPPSRVTGLAATDLGRGRLISFEPAVFWRARLVSATQVHADGQLAALFSLQHPLPSWPLLRRPPSRHALDLARPPQKNRETARVVPFLMCLD